MKKGKFLVAVLIGLLMAGGLMIVGCDDKCNGTCIVAFDENGNRFNFSSSSCGSGGFTCMDTCNVVKEWSNGTRYKEVRCNCD